MARTDEVRPIRLLSTSELIQKRAVIRGKTIVYGVTAPLVRSDLLQMQGSTRREKRANLRAYQKRVQKFQKALQEACHDATIEKNPSFNV